MASPESSHSTWNTDALKIAGLVLGAGGMVLSHYLTPADAHHAILHDIYRRVLYIPIILAAFWFGWRGGLLCAGLIVASYFPHIYHDWGGHFLNTNLNRTLEAVMYLVVGGITGSLIDRLRGSYRRLAAQSQRLEDTLRELTERTRDVFEAEEQLRRADRLAALGQLTTGLAYEIRNPLGSLRGAADILSDPETPPEQRREFGRVLVEETERLEGVLKNFLDYARAQRNGAPSSAEVHVVMELLLTLLDKKMRSAGVQVEISVPDDLPRVGLSSSMLQQVLLNLMLNAIQAMPEGGTLLLQAERDDKPGYVRITVGDSGAGIPLNVRGQVFDPFFTTKAMGTGLGLSIVHKIIANHHGRVYVDSGAEPGTRMIIELPAA